MSATLAVPTTNAPTTILPASGPAQLRLRALHALLDAAVDLPAEYGDGLSSHLPMALEALHALGADADRLRRFAAAYASRFDDHSPRPSPLPLAGAPLLGQFDHLHAWQLHFRQRLAADGRDMTLRTALRQLMPGVAAAAFHGLIRVAHAVRAQHDGELAAALAYWASRFQPSPLPSTAAPLALASGLGALAALARRHGSAPGSLISARMAAWASREDAQRVAARLAPADLPALAAWAAAQYADTRNFTILHVVTASAALRRLSPWLDEQSLAHAPPAIAMALLASGVMSRPAPSGTAQLASMDDWPTLAAAAVAQEDDHVIKLTLACRELDEAAPASVWRMAAARALAGR